MSCHRLRPIRELLNVNMSAFSRLVVASSCLATFVLGINSSHANELQPVAAKKPNVVLFYIDDLGYGDIQPFSAAANATPNLNRMAAEGRKFTNFVVSSAVCSASRAALLTGCIHERVGIIGALGPASKIGIADRELTLGELFRNAGYKTGCFGKWHLGHLPQFLPTNNGFDRYVGLPYSNDMWPFHPERSVGASFPALPLFDQDQIKDADVTAENQQLLTKTYTEEAVRFIRDHANDPFFVYIPHSMVHVPLFVSREFDNRTGKGIFADVMSEVDWSVGTILDLLAELKLDSDTIVMFTSDNGPWLSYGGHAGSAGPLREGKGTAWEGGIRVPTLVRWPGKIPAGTSCNQFASTIDVLPTMAKLIGGDLPKNKIDGHDISELMLGVDGSVSPHESFPCYYDHELRAVRDNRWKLYFPHQSRSLTGRVGSADGIPIRYESIPVGLELYDLENDIGERANVAHRYPEVVSRLQAAADKWRQQLGDSLTKVTGTEVRKADTVEKKK